jgi:hypothetical protein
MISASTMLSIQRGLLFGRLMVLEIDGAGDSDNCHEETKWEPEIDLDIQAHASEVRR